MDKIICQNPKCKSEKVVKFGKVPTVNNGVKQRYRCQVCAKTFYGEVIKDKENI